MDKQLLLKAYISAHPAQVSKVVAYNNADRFLQLNFTGANKQLASIDLGDKDAFSNYITHILTQHNCRYGIGGYMEHRAIYKRSPLFAAEEEPRQLHLGTDIWAPAGTAVYAPLAGVVHSFADNNHFGDYGPTIILQHDLDGLLLYTLYGHLNRAALAGLYSGKGIRQGEKIAEFGIWEENGSWPPHLHFQLMFDMLGNSGDFPGVGKFSEQDALRENIPDPDVILNLNTTTILP